MLVIITVAAALNRSPIRLKRELYQPSCSYYPHICLEREQRESRHFKTELVDAGRGDLLSDAFCIIQKCSKHYKKTVDAGLGGSPQNPPSLYMPRGLP